MNEVLVYLSFIHNGNWSKIYKSILEKESIDKEKMKDIVENLDCKYITLLDPLYPMCLKTIYKPPFVLYYKGDLTILTSNFKKIAVIGSRLNSEYGKAATETICETLAKEKCVIVSGFAKGIDSIAHEVCLDHNGKTIGVLGNGFNVIYPKENKRLFEKIVEKGLLISEYPPNVTPNKNYFLERNRIIAGISDAISVMEAKKKSGTMNTVSHALENGKQIFCVPDKYNNDSGCNKLIKEGAKLIENGQDILEEL